MKPYHVKLRWMCEICQNFEDKDFFFDTFFSAKRCISQAIIHLNFDVGFVIYKNDVLIRIEKRKEVSRDETQK